ncbi:MAG: DUF2330 domain-containing protein [Candidatus Brocadiia bacterium]
MRTWFLVAVGLILLFVAQRSCFADGCFLPPLSVKSPDMPQQRAIIVYRNGVERLIIESAFQGETGEYAWILPVPSEPLEIKKASNPLFKTMFHDLGKKAVDVRMDREDAIGIASVFLIGIAIFFLTIAMLKKAYALYTSMTAAVMIPLLAFVSVVSMAWRGPSYGGLVVPLVLLVILWLLRKRIPRTAAAVTCLITVLCIPAIVFPNIVARRGGSSESSLPVVVLRSQTIGDYDISVLKAADADALDFWLSAHSFQGLGPEGRRIAGEYIAEKWCFLAGKVRKAEDRISAPHPVEVSFKTDAPVYPMRLTSLAGGPLYVDLILVGAEAYECPILQTEFTSTFRVSCRDSVDGFLGWDDKKWTAFQTTALALSGTNSWRINKFVQHPEVKALLWNGCTISKLSGDLTPALMREDIRPVRGETGKMSLLFTERATVWLSECAGACTILLLALLFPFSLIFQKAIASRTIFRGIFPILIFLAIPVLVGGTVWLAMPTAEIQEVSLDFRSGDSNSVYSRVLSEVCRVPGGPAEKLFALCDLERDTFPNTPEEKEFLRQIADAMLPLLRKADMRNPVTGEPISFETSPGNLVLSPSCYERECVLSVLIFDAMGWSPRVLDVAHFPERHW